MSYPGRAESVEQNILTELRDGAEGQFGIAQCGPHFVPAELVAAHVSAALFVAHAHHPFFFCSEEVRLCWIVGETEPDQDGADHAEEAFDDVDPSG
ncbi:unnamed protein product [Aspergillus oryzae]|uniref:Unnamed protein product n=2 Tax=Aspergillus oryzae TaxID=5062 RepID=A0AAN4YZ46_ASPOZ|nr:unnamed protein product [Aspergillus oryzae]GMF89516.1 unnamed protein product [Aspergillus oryzae]GMG05014.1 unnamed protein product [Aspergillus oryzae]GMG36598.1 unnamed protein product [Aspergillus oryzae]GMG51572.1 unnamed protein product [Aspergillus oryzae var. brunneus]